MQYVLFMMFLITAPGQSLPKDKRLYTLQTTQSIEFESSAACAVARDSIADSVAITDTILLVSSCLPKGEVKPAAAAAAAPAPARAPLKPDANGVIQFKTLPR